MKKIVLFTCSLFVFFFAGFYLAHWLPQVPSYLAKSPVREEGRSERFYPTAFPIQNCPFALVIVGKNNGAFVEKTLKSVFVQKYDNFRAFYIDDASTDGSFDLARDLIYESALLNQITLVRNEKTLGPVANLARAVEACRDEEIVVVLNGEDRLAHEWVLERLNQYYANPDLWLTFGQYLEYPSFTPGTSRPYLKGEGEEKDFRHRPFTASHLKTFYASLFKKIQATDLLVRYEGTGEAIYMVPLLEMAQDHFQFIPETLYLAVTQEKINSSLASHLEEGSPYFPVASLFPFSAMEESEGEAPL